MSNPLSEIDSFLFDLDGTLLIGDTLTEGAARLFSFLHEKNFSSLVLTNNTTRSPHAYHQRITRLGVNIPPDRILTAAGATASYLNTHLSPQAPLYVIGESALISVLQEAGFQILPDPHHPVEAVVVGGDRQLTYQKLKDACLLIQQGAQLIGTNPDVVYPAREGLVPEAGTTLAALQAATGKNPLIIGKPEKYLFEIAVERLGSIPSRTAIVGDRLDTDILGGKRAGLTTVLVTTGVDTMESIPEKAIDPDLVIDNLEKLLEYIPEK